MHSHFVDIRKSYEELFTYEMLLVKIRELINNLNDSIFALELINDDDEGHPFTKHKQFLITLKNDASVTYSNLEDTLEEMEANLKVIHKSIKKY